MLRDMQQLMQELGRAMLQKYQAEQRERRSLYRTIQEGKHCLEVQARELALYRSQTPSADLAKIIAQRQQALEEVRRQVYELQEQLHRNSPPRSPGDLY